MPKEPIKISELTPATSLAGFYTLGYKIVDGGEKSVRLDLSYVQTAYQNTVDATGKANQATAAANKAAKDANATMTQISQEASQKMTDLRQLEATVSEQEKARESFYTQVQAKEQVRQNDEVKRQEAAAATTEAERLRVLKEDERNSTFNAKIQEASDAAAEAKTQGDYAKRQGDKAGTLTSRIVDLEEGKIDGGYAEENMLYLTVGGVPVGDPIPVGSGGGGGGAGGGGVLMKVRAIGETLISAIQGGTLRIGYNFVSTYMDDQSETGDGTATYLVNSQKVATEAIVQGDNYFDVTKYLVLGTNKVKVTVLDSTGQSRSVLFTVEVISLSISDSYDDTQINAGEITYRYTPTGAIAKTVHFILDGKEIGTEETTVSNRQLTYVIPTQAHGAHRLVAYMTATVNGVEVRSNELAHDLICVAEGNNTIIVASSFNQTTAQQYDRLSIPFVVYNPAASTSAVTLSVNGEVLSEQTVDRTKHEWNYRITKPGAHALKIASGSVSRTFNLNVSEAEVLVEAETADLELYLTSQNRSNNDNNRDEWKYGDIKATMTGFNWKTNGWLTDDKGSTCLRVSGSASVDIPLKLFEQDLRSTGKTFEVEFLVRDVYRYDTPVISCWSGNRGILITSQSAQIKSEQSDITTKFKDEERIRLAFVVEKKADNRLLSVYVNGIKSISFQYPETDNFMQAVPVNITIGGEDATVDLYTIRSYNNNLNRYQLINNFIADIDDYDRKVEVYQKNDIYDAYGNISFAKVRERLDVLVLEGDLPQYKGDKKTNKIYHYSSANDVLNWWANIKNNVQGTSSQYYPRKNYKFELIDGLTYIDSGEHADAFQLAEDVLPASIFCIKTDFAESSGTYNTGVANYADWMLKEMGILTEAQKEDPNVRTTIAGKPCALFHKATPDSEPVFIGKVNFNTDKAAEETFGFKDGDESWEFLNNTSDMALFKSADFTKWQETIEARYPDGGADITNVKVIFDWVVSCKGDPDKFKAEYSHYFDKEMLVFYALITLVLGMTDQRAKNMFLTRYRGKLWLFILYDNDTLLPINNEGLIALLYNVETQDKVNGANVWNGADSELWKLVEEAFADEIREMYYTMRQRNILSYDRMMEYLYSRQAGKWCEAIYNEDGYYKYEQPLIEGYLDYSQSHENPQIIKTGAYLYALQGSREMYGKWIWKNRFLYLDSKFLAGSILGDTAVFRTYTPAEWAGVKPCADITLTAFNAMYFNVKWGSVTRSQRVGFNETVTMTAPENMQFNDTETIIYGASLIASLGDLSPLYPGTVDVSKMAKLKELIVGSGAEGYQNRNLHSLSIGENRLLKKLDVRNCPEYSEPIDVRNCTNIEEIYAQGTAITAVNLPEGGNLTKLYLPGTVTNLSLKNQPKLLDSHFELAGVEKLSTIVYEATNVDIFSIIDRCLSLASPVLSRVRLVNINGHAANLDTLYKLISIGGIDEQGNNVDKAVVTGKFHADTVRADRLAIVQAAFPELTITYSQIKELPTTTFVFTSSQYKTITNATFECNFEYTKVDEKTYKVVANEGEVIEFTFRCDNHKELFATYDVAGTRTQSYKVTYLPLIKLRATLYGTSTYFEGAKIKIGAETYTSDADGYVQIRTNAQIDGTISYIGYKDQAFTVTPQLNDTTVTVYLYQTVTVTFTVKDNYGGPVIGSTIQLGDQTKTTNKYGECVFEAAKGSYDYIITNNMYSSNSGTINVSTSNINRPIATPINWETYRPEPNGNIQMFMVDYTASTSSTLRITSTDTSYLIDWGDGTITEASGIGTQIYTHVYGRQQGRLIEISNCENITECIADRASTNYGQHCLFAYFSIGNSKISGMKFENNENLKIVGDDIFKNDTERKDYSLCFYCCRSLVKLPSFFYDIVFDGCDFSSMCNSCNELQEVPPLWETAINTTKSSSCFTGCSKASNRNDIPREWGGPLTTNEVQVAIFKDNAWYLNQRVTVNGYTLAQMADGTYKGEVKGGVPGNGTAYDLIVNGVVQGDIIISPYGQNRKSGYYFIGDNPEIYQEGYFMDFTQGDLHEDCIDLSRQSNFVYDAEKGGLTSVKEANISMSQMYLRLKKQKVNPLNLYSGIEYKAIFSKQGDTVLHQGGASWRSDYENEEIVRPLEVGRNEDYFYHDGSTSSSGYVCFKSITIDKITLPELPPDFVPATPVSGAVLADYYAVNRRLARVETALGFND